MSNTNHGTDHVFVQMISLPNNNFDMRLFRYEVIFFLSLPYNDNAGILGICLLNIKVC